MILPSYPLLIDAIDHAMRSAETPADLKRALRHDPQCIRLRKSVTAEAQVLYGLIADEFSMPIIPVYVPLRFKSNVRGLAVRNGSVPREIRIYLFLAPSTERQIGDIRTRSAPGFVETLVHECAHVLDTVRRGQTDHGREFETCCHRRSEIAQKRRLKLYTG